MSEYVGFDVSKEETTFCVKDEEGKILARGKAPSDPDALFEVLRAYAPCPRRIVLETGTMSAWLARGLRRRAMPVEVIDARQAHAVMKLQHNKTDANDAALLAEIARSGFCRSVAISSEVSQARRMLLKARMHLVRQHRDTANAVRGLLGAFGIRFAKGVSKLADRVHLALRERPELAEVIEPLLSSMKALKREIARLDALVTTRAEADPSCRLLMSVPGVGAVTALAFVATIDDPARFGSSRTVGAYLGLTARRHQSGEVDYSGRISKRGDGMMRTLLYEAANSLLTRVRKAHPLKDWARRIRKRSCHKKACVALARKLAVIMHRMLITGEMFRWPQEQERAKA